MKFWTLYDFRFRYSVTGLLPYKTKKRMGVLSLASTGDIFYQYAHPNTGFFDQNATELNEEELQFLEDWENDFRTEYLRQNRSITITRTVNFSELMDCEYL